MFIKITKSGNYKYAQAVKSYRKDGLVKHKVLFNLGRLDIIYNNPSFQNFARKLLELSNDKTSLSLDSISEAELSNWGYVVYKKIWDDFGLGRILKEVSSKTKISYSLSDTSFLMVISHLLNPSSKLACYNSQQRYTNMPPVNLNDIYRSLDILADAKEKIESQIFDINRNLFNLNVDVVFYDVTTFSFSSVIQDSLKDFGFSKNGRPGKVQVVMGLLVDLYGRPIGYELFAGNTFDSKTLPKALDKLEKRFGIRKVIIVADKGINSKINLRQITEKGYSYIFAYRLKSAPGKIKDEAFKDGYSEINNGEPFKYKVINYTHNFYHGSKKVSMPQKIIITYSEARAKKDAADRERMVGKACALLEDISKIKTSNKRGAKKYIVQEADNINYKLDIDAINNDEKFDGYYAIATNEDNIKEEDVIRAYHNLYKIEESFRIMKNSLEVEPIFVWTPKRIKGHFVICFLSFLLARHLEYKLAKNNIQASVDKIRSALNSLNFAKVSIDDKSYYIKTKAEDLAYKMLRILKIPSPKNITPEEELNL